ncbi:MAG TPA: hypothetical protein PLW93_02815, partial [Candidatus Absconditabacterales bacterium]|nr:hypothetical protein [Candidatus Absconditabacterales bacterium]
LHTELATLFPQTKQAGSLVDSDYLRFDFYADRLLDKMEITHIENTINNIIKHSSPVIIQEMSFDQATSLGAKAFFEDKYGNIVRTVKISKLDDQGQILHDNYSFELCGGTHVSHTKDIGAFIIIGQQAVASGIKRITALTGPKVVEYNHEQGGLLDRIGTLLDCSVGQIEEKLSKMVSDHQVNLSLIESFKHTMIDQQLKISTGTVSFDPLIISPKDIQIYFKSNQLDYDCTILVGNSFVIYSPFGDAKKLMQAKGWTGGGSDTLCQGKIV